MLKILKALFLINQLLTVIKRHLPGKKHLIITQVSCSNAPHRFSQHKLTQGIHSSTSFLPNSPEAYVGFTVWTLKRWPFQTASLPVFLLLSSCYQYWLPYSLLRLLVRIRVPHFFPFCEQPNLFYFVILLRFYKRINDEI